MSKKSERTLPTIENRKARFDYHIDETLECGIALMGSEVKSVRAGQVSLGEGYVVVSEEPPSISLINVDIGEYQPAGSLGHRRTRSRVLLARKKDIARLAKIVSKKGMTIVPLKLYFKGAWAKVLIGVARGKTSTDKRQTIAQREAKREIDRAMSKRRP